MQMLVLANSGGFTPVAPMLFSWQLTLAVAETHCDRRCESLWEKMGKFHTFLCLIWVERIGTFKNCTHSKRRTIYLLSLRARRFNRIGETCIRILLKLSFRL